MYIHNICASENNNTVFHHIIRRNFNIPVKIWVREGPQCPWLVERETKQGIPCKLMSMVCLRVGDKDSSLLISCKRRAKP